MKKRYLLLCASPIIVGAIVLITPKFGSIQSEPPLTAQKITDNKTPPNTAILTDVNENIVTGNTDESLPALTKEELEQLPQIITESINKPRVIVAPSDQTKRYKAIAATPIGLPKPTPQNASDTDVKQRINDLRAWAASNPDSPPPVQVNSVKSGNYPAPQSYSNHEVKKLESADVTYQENNLPLH